MIPTQARRVAASMETAKKVAAAEPDPVNQLAVLRYGLDHWDAHRIEVEIGQAAEWGKRWNVPLTCNEFGVYRRDSDPQDRARWLHDVRATLERDGIHIRYYIDLAEIPTYQELQQADIAPANADAGSADVKRYVAARGEELGRGLMLEVDGAGLAGSTRQARGGQRGGFCGAQFHSLS